MNRMHYRGKILVLACGALLLAACGRPADIRDGEQLAIEAGCVACHGTNGRGIGPTFPNLNNQWPEYLYQQLRKYHSGERVNAIMNIQAQELTREQMELLARYYAAQ